MLTNFAISNCTAKTRPTSGIKSDRLLGYSLDPETGDVLWGDSTGGAFALEALAHGYRRFGSPCYLQTAKRLAA